MVLTASSTFGEERSAEWKKLNDEAWEMVGREFPELFKSHESTIEIAKFVGEVSRKLKTENPEMYNDPYHPVYIVRSLMSDEKKEQTAEPLPVSAPAPAPEKKEPSEWLKKNAHAWQIMREEFPAHFVNNVTRERLRFLIYKYDKSAKANDPELYRDPYKPLYFLRHYEAKKAEIARQEEARRHAPPPRWEEYVDNSHFQEARRQARMSDAERQAEQMEQEMDEMQRKIDAANKKLRDIENGTYK